MNRVELDGFLKAAPELRDVGAPPYQSLCATFTLITSSVRFDRKTETDVVDKSFIYCQAWEDLAELVAPWQLGAYVHILGELTQREVAVSATRTERKTHVRVLVPTLVRTPPRARPAPEPGEEPSF